MKLCACILNSISASLHENVTAVIWFPLPLFQLKHLTGSTANVYLEYIERNVPEGVALEITKVSIDV